MKRVAWLIALMVAVIVASKLLVENVLGIALEPLVQSWLNGAGSGTAMVIIALLVADVVLPIPSSVVMVLSGAAFGVVTGSIVALVGSIAGEWLGFELVRHYGRALSRRMISDDEFARFDRIFQRHGALAIAVTRALPVVMETMSLVAGLTRMRRRSFLVASFIGTTPVVVVYAWAGAMSSGTGSLLPAIVFLVATAALAWVIYRSRIAAD